MKSPIRLPRTLRGRLTLWYALLIGGAFAVFSVTTLLIAGGDEDSDSPQERQEAEQLELAFLLGIPPVLVIAVLGGSWTIRRSLRPFDDMAGLARGLDPTRLDARVPVPDGAAAEIVNVADSFNSMLDRIAKAMSGIQQFTANASHELRTPLSALRSDLEVDLRRDREADDYRATLARALSEVDRMTRLVEDLLVLARSDAGEQSARHEAVHVTETIRGAVAAVVSATSREVAIDGDTSLVVSGDAKAISRAISNLVENACKHTPAGTAVQVQACSADGFVDIIVDDSGEGIPAEEREHVFGRFYRGSEAQAKVAGSGLGLALALEIARHHGGTIGLEDSPLGGLRARLRIPQLNFVPN